MARRAGAAWGGVVALALAVFVVVTQQMMGGGQAGSVDRAILLWMAELRTPPLTALMVGVTLLGSPKPFAVVTLVALAALIALRDRRGAVHLAAAGVGTWILEVALKNLLERARPTEVLPLREVSGYSYPSGHALAASALYLTLAIVAGRHVQSRAAKAALIAAVLLVIVMVGLSRVYLGVHYPSDVLSGFALGTAWALILSAMVSIGPVLVRRGNKGAEVAPGTPRRKS